MNERDDEDKTEEATDERRKQYREEGRVANPREIVHSLSIIILALCFYVIGQNLETSLGAIFKNTWFKLNPTYVTSNMMGQIFFQSLKPIIPMMGFFLVALVLLPVTTGLIFTQFNWTWKKLTFDWNNMNPVSGFGRMFSTKAVPELIKSMAKLIILSSVAYVIIKPSIINASRNLFLDLPIIVKDLGTSILQLLFALGVASLIIGLGDWYWNWWQLEKQMRMTKEELKEEVKSQEGDPHVRSARRRMARDFVLSKSLQQVPKATFIVTNPEHFAVAIQYYKGMASPIVVAKGMDFLALKIRELAKKNDIVIVENKPLARTLYKTVKIGGEVPPSLYASIIEVMKYIRHLKGRDYFEKLTLAGDNA